MTKPERLYALLLHSTARSVKFRDFRGCFVRSALSSTAFTEVTITIRIRASRS